MASHLIILTTPPQSLWWPLSHSTFYKNKINLHNIEASERSQSVNVVARGKENSQDSHTTIVLIQGKICPEFSPGRNPFPNQMRKAEEKVINLFTLTYLAGNFWAIKKKHSPLDVSRWLVWICIFSQNPLQHLLPGSCYIRPILTVLLIIMSISCG